MESLDDLGTLDQALLDCILDSIENSVSSLQHMIHTVPVLTDLHELLPGCHPIPCLVTSSLQFY